jgi:hypothetical protein
MGKKPRRNSKIRAFSFLYCIGQPSSLMHLVFCQVKICCSIFHKLRASLGVNKFLKCPYNAVDMKNITRHNILFASYLVS